MVKSKSKTVSLLSKSPSPSVQNIRLNEMEDQFGDMPFDAAARWVQPNHLKSHGEKTRYVRDAMQASFFIALGVNAKELHFAILQQFNSTLLHGSFFSTHCSTKEEKSTYTHTHVYERIDKREKILDAYFLFLFFFFWCSLYMKKRLNKEREEKKNSQNGMENT